MDEVWDAEEVVFEHRGTVYRISQHAPRHWFVYEGERHVGEVEHAVGPGYLSHTPGQSFPYDLSQSEDWHTALEYLLDNSA